MISSPVGISIVLAENGFDTYLKCFFQIAPKTAKPTYRLISSGTFTTFRLFSKMVFFAFLKRCQIMSGEAVIIYQYTKVFFGP